MLHLQQLSREFFSKLRDLDEKITELVAAGGCPHCKGPLHRSDYDRKPRGGLWAAAGEMFTRRYSLCCGRPGCRKRSLPPSLRFLGRRVYLEAVVLMASVWAQIVTSVREAVSASGVPARTLKRWGNWWREVFPTTRTWIELRARFIPPPPNETLLPRSLVVRVESDLKRPNSANGSATEDVMLFTARFLAALTTNSVSEGSGFVTGAVAQMAAS